MFTSGMQESQQQTIELKDISYPVFAAICQYLYTGEIQFGAETEGQELSLDYMLEFLAVSDEFILDEFKIQCQKNLIDMLSIENFEKISKLANKCNANSLIKYCDWYEKRLAGNQQSSN